MNVLIAPDKYKGCLTANQVGEAIRLGVLDYNEGAKCHYLYVSDGGDGFQDAVKYYHPEIIQKMVNVSDPLGRTIKTNYLLDPIQKTAYIEMALASGLALLNDGERDVMKTSSLGTGQMISHAIENGAQTIYVGLGGSATNDGGTGIACALGFRFYDPEGRSLVASGTNLQNIHTINKPDSFPDNVRIIAVNDVQNPLYGPQGASYTYADQKGASKAQIEVLDQGLRNLDHKVKEQFGLDLAGDAGSGAAGGAAYGLKAFLGATFESGTSFMLKMAGFHELISKQKIDLIITGEGKMDAQTAHGKMIHGLANEAKSYNIPVVAVCGKLDTTEKELSKMNILKAVEIYDPEQIPGYSFKHAAKLIRLETLDLLGSLEK